MRRVVSLFFPTWPTDRLRRISGTSASPDKPLVTSVHDGRRLVIASVDRAAVQAGLAAGMNVAEARTLVANLDARESNPAAEQADLLKLCLWCQRYTPLTAPDPPSGLWLDVTGVTHLFGGESRLLTDLVATLARNGFACRAAIADTPGTTHAMARFAPGSSINVVPSGGEQQALSTLPMAALRLPYEVIQGLSRLGFDRIGQLLGVRLAPLVHRLGTELSTRLDQALGHSFEPIDPVFAPDAVQSRLGFADPILSREGLSHAIGLLLNRICQSLAESGQGARKLDLILQRVDSSYQVIRVGLAQASHDAAHLTTLFERQIERIEPGFGIEIMILSVTRAEKFIQRVAGTLFSAEGATEDALAVLTDRLTNTARSLKLYRAKPVESNLPERSVALIAPLDPPCGGSWDGAWPRPTRLLPAPELVEATALLPDLPPAFFVWRGCRHRVRRADGPERLHGEWWRADDEIDTVRDYYQLEDEEGARFWLFRAGVSNTARWYLHGLFA